MEHSQIVQESDLHEPKSHASSHEDGGSDEINISKLSGYSGLEVDFTTTDLKPDIISSVMQLIWQLPALITTLETNIEMLEANQELRYSEDDFKVNILPTLIQLLRELPATINTLETKISILAQEVKRINTNFDLNDIF